jgi:hypothetical protein
VAEDSVAAGAAGVEEGGSAGAGEDARTIECLLRLEQRPIADPAAGAARDEDGGRHGGDRTRKEKRSSWASFPTSG